MRQRCVDYINAERKYFGDFIEGGDSGMDEYLAKKASDGCWGDDIEIQAMCEIYDRPIEIYEYDNIPMKTFHEASEDQAASKNKIVPFRLSRHQAAHYNSIVPTTWSSGSKIIKTKPGQIEDEAISYSLECAALETSTPAPGKQCPSSEAPSQMTFGVPKQQKSLLKNFNDPNKIRQAVQESRHAFEKLYQEQMAEVMLRSREELEQEEFKSIDSNMAHVLNASRRDLEAQEQAEIQKAMRESRLGFDFGSSH